jgi:hypothetical protein
MSKRILYCLTFIFFLASLFVALTNNVYAQCDDDDDCISGWFCSLNIECCQCVYGNDAGGRGPVTCCPPPGGGGSSCSTYEIDGCAAPPTPTPAPTAVATPVPTAAPTTAPTPPVEDNPYGALPIPRPTPIPCDETRDNEFHSLRPYQASPCNRNATDLALYCGNDFILLDRIVIEKIYSSITGEPPYGTYPITWEYRFEGEQISPVRDQSDYVLACRICNSAGECVENRPPPCIPDLGCQGDGDCEITGCVINEDGTETCRFVFDREVDIAVDLSGTELPIMGYTEPSQGTTDPYTVINSVNFNETLTDPDKVNEYVSWYLYGTIGRAEYRPPERNFWGVLTEEGKRKVIDYSGPLKRLLAFESQIVKRWQEVLDTRTSLRCDPNQTDPSSDPDCIRHNQIIGCYNLLGNPTPCYPSRIWKRSFRINDWYFAPPLLRDYPSGFLYNLADFAWKLVHFNRWKLYSYIPFSSTEDRIGEAEISSYTIQPAFYSRVVILYSAITNQVPAKLFFAHMQESFELADILQSIFSYQGADLDAEPLDVVSSYAPLCNILEYRKNPGDNLFAGDISATVEYTAQVACNFINPGLGRLCEAAGGECYSKPEADWVCDTYYNQVDCDFGDFCGENCERYVPPTYGSECGVGDLYTDYFCFPSSWGWEDPCVVAGNTMEGPLRYQCDSDDIFCHYYLCINEPPSPDTPISDFSYTEVCSVQVPISFKTDTKTPLAKEVWSKLVSGPAGAFRRIFPQIEDEEGRPVRRLWDIPAATSVRYTSLTENVTVPGGGNADLFFPHIGGVHEYFLNCIQKTLRPYGYGYGCITGPPPLTHITGEGDCATPPPPGTSTFGSGLCEIPEGGFCSPEYLMNATGWTECQAQTAAIICNRESGGNPSAINCGCLTGTSVDYSVGLFQINLLAHTAETTPQLRCYEAFEYSCYYYWCENQGEISCTILDQDVVNQCADYYFDATNNITKAYQLSLGGTNWTPWSAATACADEIAALGCP